MNYDIKPRISILILTHNRPTLFNRCIESVFSKKPDWAEIIVNNDGCPILHYHGAKYHGEINEDISITYKFLFDEARGEFVYFLEDDDFVNDNFWEIIEEGLKHNWNLLYRYVPENSIKRYIKYFLKEPEFKEHFQLGQMVIKKSSVTEFPTGNFINNDWRLFEHVAEKGFMHIDKPIFTQTTDGKDNISFPEYNKDKRFA